MTRIDLIDGTAIPLRGSNIDTDRIIPARFLKTITFEGLGEHVFADDRRAVEGHPFDDPRYKHATVLFVNENFGSGSSREHAPQALKRWGIGACVGESFSEIFRGNALAIGLACATANPTDVEQAMQIVEAGATTPVRVSVSGLTLEVGTRVIPLTISPGERGALLDGHWDATGLLLDQFEQVRAAAAGLPYMNGF